MQTHPVKILLVEDDDVDAEAVARAFKKHKIANPITRARDGVEALEILRGQVDVEGFEAPYLVMTDINMPRMDGIEFIRALRNDPALKSVIAFVLTTSDSEQDKINAYNLNVAGYLVKSKVGEGFLKLIGMLDSYWRVVEFPVSK